MINNPLSSLKQLVELKSASILKNMMTGKYKSLITEIEKSTKKALKITLGKLDKL